MKITPEIQPGEGYWYLGSPFTNYPAGHEQAWLDVARVRGALVAMGIHCYSPICESWGVWQQCQLPVDHTFWRGDNMSKMVHAKGIIVARLVTWDSSEGLANEIRQFEEWGRPTVHLDP